jgi:hypothetical protein
MFFFAISLGILSYLVFFLGIVGYLYTPILLIICIVYLLFLANYFKSSLWEFVLFCSAIIQKGGTIQRISLVFLCLITLVNLLGALAPELAFDALWYHLTFPKLYLLNHSIYYIPGGLLYYSVLPKLTELLYVLPLSIGNEVSAKVLHFCFGVFCLIALYKFAREFLSQMNALLVTLIFASNPVFMWESTTAYIDLSRTFYEVLALWAFVLHMKKKDNKWFFLSAILLGFAASAKILSIGSTGIFFLLLIGKNSSGDQSFFFRLKRALQYMFVVLLIPFPWFVFSYFSTGNPIYPIFSGYDTSLSSTLFSPVTFLFDITKIFLFADDPISPIYLLCLPLLFIYFRKFTPVLKTVSFYSLFALILWYVTPRTGGGRFLLPYLPAFSLLIGAILQHMNKQSFIYKTVLSAVFIVSLSSLCYRAAAEIKYIPVVFGKETKQEFLSTHLQYSYGDFYDTDGYFARNITEKDTVLLIGFHNLYYVTFRFIDASWVTKGDRFNYIATQNVDLPARFISWKEVYTNPRTMVSVYTNNKMFVRY